MLDSNKIKYFVFNSISQKQVFCIQFKCNPIQYSIFISILFQYLKFGISVLVVITPIDYNTFPDWLASAAI